MYFNPAKQPRRKEVLLAFSLILTWSWYQESQLEQCQQKSLYENKKARLRRKRHWSIGGEKQANPTKPLERKKKTIIVSFDFLRSEQHQNSALSTAASKFWAFWCCAFGHAALSLSLLSLGHHLCFLCLLFILRFLDPLFNFTAQNQISNK